MRYCLLANLPGYAPVVVMFVIALVLVAATVLLSILCGPGNKGPVKGSPYESGVDPVGSARARFNVRFYLIAVLFLVFDVELIFFYPFAVIFYQDRSGWYLLLFMIFTFLLIVAFIYDWLKGAFDWR